MPVDYSVVLCSYADKINATTTLLGQVDSILIEAGSFILAGSLIQVGDFG